MIRTKNNSVENKYIRSMKLNGEELTEPRFSHFDLMRGGELVFEMENLISTMKRGITLCIAVSLCAGVYAGNNPGIY